MLRDAHASVNSKVSAAQPRSIGVMIATYHRPAELIKCLTALGRQLLPADEIVVVGRQDDSETQAALDSLNVSLPIMFITVREAGVVAARNAGLNASHSDIIATIDDDTVPHPDWLSRIMENFAKDSTLGGLGGRDRCFNGTTFDDNKEAVVGKIQWYGRVIGNHHRGFGAIREVDVLKGANMSFRARAIERIRYDARLIGEGTQPNDDKCFSIALKVSGWKVAYDPSVVVDHYPGYRADARQYVGASRVKDVNNFYSFCYNEVVSIWDFLSKGRRIIFFIWSTLVGTATFPGFVQAVRFTPKLGVHSWHRFWIAQQAKVRAFCDLTA